MGVLLEPDWKGLRNITFDKFKLPYVRKRREAFMQFQEFIQKYFIANRCGVVPHRHH